MIRKMTAETTYGQRFFDAWKRYSGSLGSFDYAEIQALKAADCEAFIAILRKRNAHLPYTTIQLLRECEPEEAARVMFTQAQAANQTNWWLFVMMT